MAVLWPRRLRKALEATGTTWDYNASVGRPNACFKLQLASAASSLGSILPSDEVPQYVLDPCKGLLKRGLRDIHRQDYVWPNRPGRK